MREINLEKLYDNLLSMINTLEFDAMRSPGKLKANATELNGLYELKKKYEAMMPKPTPKKKEG